MHEPVEPAKLRADRTRHIVEIVGGCRGQVERQDRRLRMSGRHDLVVDRLQLAHDAPVQHDCGPARGAGEREGLAEPARSAGYHDHAAGQIDIDGGAR